MQGSDDDGLTLESLLDAQDSAKLYTPAQHRIIGRGLRAAYRELKKKEAIVGDINPEIASLINCVDELRCVMDDGWGMAIGVDCRLHHSPYYNDNAGCSSCNPPED